MITSHFIGIFLFSEELDTLLNLLQDYIQKNNLSTVIELVRPKSFHVTMYYLGKEISSQDLKKIKKIQAEIKKQERNLFQLESIHFFKTKDEYRIGYLGVKKTEILSFWNKKIKEHINHEFVPDNQLGFIPHCTIFRIKDSKEFSNHKDEITKIIDESLSQMNLFSLKNIHLTSVDSTQKPQTYNILF